MSGTVTAPSPSNVWATGIIWPPLCAIVVALRFYTRRVQGARLLQDDWLTVPAIMLIFGLCAMLIYGVHSKALGYPTPPPADGQSGLTNNNPVVRINSQLVWVFQLVQIPALACVKLSFVFFYRRVFCTGIGKMFRRVTTATIIIIATWAVAFELAFVFICKGHFAAWWISVQTFSTYCHPEFNLEVGFASTDCITDVIVIVLPLPLIWRLQMSVSRKIAVIMIFALGALTVAASITRMVIFIRAVQNLKKKFSISRLEFKDRGRTDSTSSDIRMVAGINRVATTDTHASRELDLVLPKGEPPNSQIRVQKSFQTTDSVV